MTRYQWIEIYEDAADDDASVALAAEHASEADALDFLRAHVADRYQGGAPLAAGAGFRLVSVVRDVWPSLRIVLDDDDTADAPQITPCDGCGAPSAYAYRGGCWCSAACEGVKQADPPTSTTDLPCDGAPCGVCDPVAEPPPPVDKPKRARKVKVPVDGPPVDAPPADALPVDVPPVDAEPDALSADAPPEPGDRNPVVVAADDSINKRVEFYTADDDSEPARLWRARVSDARRVLLADMAAAAGMGGALPWLHAGLTRSLMARGGFAVLGIEQCRLLVDAAMVSAEADGLVGVDLDSDGWNLRAAVDALPPGIVADDLADRAPMPPVLADPSAFPSDARAPLDAADELAAIVTAPPMAAPPMAAPSPPALTVEVVDGVTVRVFNGVIWRKKAFAGPRSAQAMADKVRAAVGVDLGTLLSSFDIDSSGIDSSGIGSSGGVS